MIEFVVAWPAKSVAVMRKFEPPCVLPPLPVQLLPPPAASGTVIVAPFAFVQLTETAATATSSVT